MNRNKLNYIWLTFMFLFVITAYSQEKKEYQFYNYENIGVRLGAVYNSISLLPSVGDNTSEISYSGGLVYIFSNKKYVGLQLEALYTQKMWSESFDDGSVISDLKYLELPLMTNINLGSGRFKYLINIGTYFSFLLDKTQKLNITWENPHYQSILDRNERGSDFGLLIGGGLRYISNIGIFQLDIRYAHGFQKVYNEEITGFKYSNLTGINAALIYTLNLKRND